jgi:hypothetical protein
MRPGRRSHSRLSRSDAWFAFSDSACLGLDVRGDRLYDAVLLHAGQNSGGGEASIACKASRPETSAVMATLLMPSSFGPQLPSTALSGLGWPTVLHRGAGERRGERQVQVATCEESECSAGRSALASKTPGFRHLPTSDGSADLTPAATQLGLDVQWGPAGRHMLVGGSRGGVAAGLEVRTPVWRGTRFSTRRA